MAIATAVCTAATIAFYAYQWQRPPTPTITFAPVIQAAPAPNITVQAPQAPASSIINVNIGGTQRGVGQGYRPT